MDWVSSKGGAPESSSIASEMEVPLQGALGTQMEAGI